MVRGKWRWQLRYRRQRLSLGRIGSIGDSVVLLTVDLHAVNVELARGYHLRCFKQEIFQQSELLRAYRNQLNRITIPRRCRQPLLGCLKALPRNSPALGRRRPDRAERARLGRCGRFRTSNARRRQRCGQRGQCGIAPRRTRSPGRDRCRGSQSGGRVAWIRRVRWDRRSGRARRR